MAHEVLEVTGMIKCPGELDNLGKDVRYTSRSSQVKVYQLRAIANAHGKHEDAESQEK